MSPDAWGAIALTCYALVGLYALLRTLRSYSTSLRESLFTLLIRAYVPLVFGQRYRARCPWPATGTALIVSNHSSPTDPIMIHSASLMKQAGPRMRIVEWLTAREYCERPGIVGVLCDIARCIPVSREGRDMAAVREAIRRSRDGRLIGIYPEGGLNDGRNLLEFQTGVAFLALAANLPVYPVYIESAPRSDSMVGAFLTRSQTRVHFGDEVNLNQWRGGRRPSPEQLEEVTTVIRNAVLELSGVDPDRAHIFPITQRDAS